MTSLFRNYISYYWALSSALWLANTMIRGVHGPINVDLISKRMNIFRQFTIASLLILSVVRGIAILPCPSNSLNLHSNLYWIFFYYRDKKSHWSGRSPRFNLRTDLFGYSTVSTWFLIASLCWKTLGIASSHLAVYGAQAHRGVDVMVDIAFSWTQKEKFRVFSFRDRFRGGGIVM